MASSCCSRPAYLFQQDTRRVEKGRSQLSPVVSQAIEESNRIESNRIEPNRIETNRIHSNRVANACALNGAQTSGRSCGNLISKARCQKPIRIRACMERLGDNLIKMLGAPGFSFPACSHALGLPRAMASRARRTNRGAGQPLHALCISAQREE